MDKVMPKLEARVRPYQDQSGRATKLLAFAELIIADAFVIKGIRVLKPENDEPFVGYPAEKGKNAQGERWFDLAHPITAEAYAAASALILERYRAAAEGPAALARR